MLKEYKTVDELITILKQRKVQFQDEIDVEIMKEYLNKYSYNSVINPYKVLYCSKILESGSHIYESEVSAKEIINFFDRSLKFNNILFKWINRFEYNFSTSLTKIYTGDFLEVKSEILEDIKGKYNIEVNKINTRLRKEAVEVMDNISSRQTTEYKYNEIYRKNYVNQIETQYSGPENIFNAIQKLKELNKRHKEISFEKDTKIKYIEVDNQKNLKDFFNESENKIRYSYFHGSKDKISFGDKIILFKLLPSKYQNLVMKDLRKLKYNDKGKYKISRTYDNFIFDLNNLKGIRNQVYHINSINYFQYKDTRTEFYKHQYNALSSDKAISKVKNSFSFKNTKMFRLIKFLKLDEKCELNTYTNDLQNIYNSTIKIYYFGNIINDIEKDSIEKMLTSQGYGDIIKTYRSGITP